MSTTNTANSECDWWWRWTVNNNKWSTVNDERWMMNDKQQTMTNDEQCTVNKEWRMMNSEWWMTTNGEQWGTANGDDRRTMTGGTMMTHEPRPGKPQQTVNHEWWTANTQPWTMNSNPRADERRMWTAVLIQHAPDLGHRRGAAKVKGGENHQVYNN